MTVTYKLPILMEISTKFTVVTQCLIQFYPIILDHFAVYFWVLQL